MNRAIAPTAKTSNTLLGLVALLFWSTTVAVGRSLTEQLGSLTAASLIYLLGGLLGSGYRILSGRLGGSHVARTGQRATSRRLVRSEQGSRGPLSAALDRLKLSISSYPPRYLLGCGSLFLLYMGCLYGGLGLAGDRHQVLEVGLLNYLWPTLTLLFSVLILKMKARISLVPGALVATAGVFLAMSQGQDLSIPFFRENLTSNVTPYILGLMGALFWALYSTLSRKWGGVADSRAVPLFMLGTGITLGLAGILSSEHPSWTGRAVAELLYMAIVQSMAYVFWDRAMRKGDIVLVASCSYLAPLLSTIIACLYLGVVTGLRLWIGCGLVILGAIVCKLSLRQDSRQPVCSS